MTCELIPAQCLAEHVIPKLGDGASIVKGTNSQWTARCPAHGDRHASLSITVADKQTARLVWQCHAATPCSATEIRAALVARGVPDGCLPRFKHQRTEDELVAELLPLLKEPGTGPLFKLRVAALVRNVELPRGGKELEDFAAECGISKTRAYEATKPLRGQSRNAGGAGWGQPRPHRDTPGVTFPQNPPAKSLVDDPRYGYATDPVPGPADPVPGPAKRHAAVTPDPVPGLGVTPARCAVCERELPLDHRTDQRTCSPRCRMKLSRRNRKDNP